jgi:hypothetical protein
MFHICQNDSEDRSVLGASPECDRPRPARPRLPATAFARVQLVCTVVDRVMGTSSNRSYVMASGIPHAAGAASGAHAALVMRRGQAA